ncbi:MAG: opacity family porin [Moraxella sp.]|uniref:opacity family porin n=1 Tax=Moraxella sp. TaxID=479 RepID=UPI0026DA90FA|nr:opacity family porin [Moraxella sp.]MDO4450846.1 opacity family porin [Moraxella sp.]
MKKLALVAMLASVSTLAVANDGLYVQADVVYGKMNAEIKSNEELGLDEKHKLKGDDPAFRVSVGNDVGNFRYAVDYTHFGKADKSVDVLSQMSENEVVEFVSEWAASNGINPATINPNLVEGGSITARAEVKAQSIGLTGIYDFPTISNMVTPYAGVRVGVNRLKGEIAGTATIVYEGDRYSETVVESAKKTKVGVGVLAGIQHAITPNLAVDVGAEYNYLGKVEDVKVEQYGGKVGLRYNF